MKGKNEDQAFESVGSRWRRRRRRLMLIYNFFPFQIDTYTLYLKSIC